MGIRRGALALLSFTVVVLTTSLVSVRPAGADDTVTYQPPVDAPVVDPFRPPKTTFGAGNRGLTYDLEPGTPVHASAPGTVVFAGWVAGTQHVTVLHGDGLRTSYSFLESVGVRRGEDVAGGAVVGTAGPGFHFGVRDGDVYLDPASLFGVVEVRVRLVPHDEPAPDTHESLLRERIALTRTVEEKGLLRRAVEWGVGRAEREVERSLDALRMVASLDPLAALQQGTHTFLDRWHADCTEPSVVAPAAPAAGRVAVLVAGYGSSSLDAAVDDVDLDALGHDASLRYSYAGGRVPDGDVAADLASIPARPYSASHTFTDLHDHGVALADLVEATLDARPRTPVDLIAHSQGGVVVRLALVELARRGRVGDLGTVVTIGTPHRGVDLGSAASLAGPVGRWFLSPIADLTDGGVDPGAPSVVQMASASSLMLELGRDGVPEGVDLRTIGATGDVVVPGDRTTVDGVPAAMIGLAGAHAHDALPGDPATTRELALAVAGEPPGCRGFVASVTDAFLPEAIGFAQNAALLGAVAALPG